MTEETNTQVQDQDVAENVNEIEVLKNRARLMGITFSNNIGLEALKKKVADKMAADSDDDDNVVQASGEQTPNPLGEIKPRSLRQALLEDEMRLIRLRITNLDPKKKDLPGEILTVANEYIGTVRKYVPFGEATEDGYHVPNCLYEQLKTRKFLHIRVVKQPNGQERVEHKMVPEFALEVLPPLTKDELRELATAQTAAGVFNPD